MQNASNIQTSDLGTMGWATFERLDAAVYPGARALVVGTDGVLRQWRSVAGQWLADVGLTKAQIAAGATSVAGLTAAGAQIDGNASPVSGGGVSALRTLVSNLAYAYANEVWTLVGDSTGNETTEWPYLSLTGMLPSLPANAYVTYRRYNDGAGRYDAPVVLQTGDGEPYVTVGADLRGWGCPRSFVGAVGGADLDVWVDAALASYTTGTQVLIAQYGGATPRNVCYLYLTAAGVPSLFWSTDGGTTNVTAAATANVTGVVSAGGRAAIRATLDTDNGSSGYTATFYTSTDGGITWVQLGSPVVGGAVTSIHNNTTQPVEIGSRNAADGSSTGGAIGGANQLPAHIRELGPTNGMSGIKGGAPSFSFFNGSIPGQNMAYFSAGDRLSRMIPRYGQGVLVINTSHNEGAGWDAPAFASNVAAFVLATKTRATDPYVMVCTQNPQTSPRTAVQIDAQARRAVAWRSLAQTNRWGVIDTYGNINWTGLLGTDGVHPIKPATASAAVALAAYRSS